MITCADNPDVREKTVKVNALFKLNLLIQCCTVESLSFVQCSNPHMRYTGCKALAGFYSFKVYYVVITKTLRCRPQWPVTSCCRNVGVLLRCLTRRFIGSLLLAFYTWNLWYVYSSICNCRTCHFIVCLCLSSECYVSVLLYIYNYFTLSWNCFSNLQYVTSSTVLLFCRVWL